MIAIIGAGPVGSYLGYLLSENGVDNTLVEEHREIGRPEQCAGLVSRNIEALVKPSWFRKSILNKVNGAVISCGKQSFEIRANDFKAYVFDRALFDQLIAEKAQNKGSRVLLGQRYISHQVHEKGLKIRLNEGSKAEYLSSSVLVGADGPCSKVARNSYLYGGRKFWTGTQAVIKTRKPFFEKDMVHVYLDRKYSDDFFAWVVPINEEKAKVGLASFSKPAEYLKRFLNDKFDDYVVEERLAGMIPVYQKIPLQNKEKNIFLVGDAALQVKAISGGGVVKGMLAAKELCDAIVKKDFDYENRLGTIRRNLWLHLKLRNKLNSMGERKKCGLIRTLNSERVRKVLLCKGDMDFPKRFLPKLLLSEPRLIKYLF